MGDSDPDDLQQELLDTGEQKGNPMTTMYDLAREEYAALGIDTEAVMEKLAAKPISVHCWQGDDVLGFDQEGGLSGGIQTTGNYPGRARTFEELTCDFEAAMALVPGAKRINLHASYAVFTDENPWVDRDAIEYKHFEPWVAWAKAHGYGIDFNPTIFGHPMMSNELSLSSPDAATRDFWIRHCKACRKISQQIGEALDDQTLCNIWIPDGLKDVPGDRFGLRERLRDSLDEIYAEKYDRVIDSCESKVFGIGLESMTVGSNEFYLAYAATHPGVYDLLDLGHFHPTENVADKLSALLLFLDFGAVTVWSVFIILFRELLVSALRMVASAAGVVVAADKLGKYKTATTMVSICGYLCVFAMAGLHLGPVALTLGIYSVSRFLYAVAVVLTVISGAQYFWNCRKIVFSV